MKLLIPFARFFQYFKMKWSFHFLQVYQKVRVPKMAIKSCWIWEDH